MNKLAIYGGEPVRRDFLSFSPPDIKSEDIKEVIATLKSGWLTTGPKVQQFEEKFREYIGCSFAVALNSCTAGLHLALRAVGVGPGDEVITTPMTFISTANSIIFCGAKPVFVDVEKETMNINPFLIEKAITPRTKAIIPVHLYGRPCRMEEIKAIANKYGLYIIEDAAHCLEGWYKNKKIGNIGDITTFSFYATKNLTCGEGGMITTNNKKFKDIIRLQSLHGMSKTAWERYSKYSKFKMWESLTLGYKYNMSDISAALGIHQLERLEKNLEKRKKLWQMYNKAFSEIDGLIIPQEEDNIKHARHLYTVLIEKKFRVNRDRIAQALLAEGIGVGIHYITLSQHKFYKETFGYKKGDFPNADYISERTLSLPLSSKLTKKDIQDVIKAVKKVLKFYRL